MEVCPCHATHHDRHYIKGVAPVFIPEMPCYEHRFDAQNLKVEISVPESADAIHGTLPPNHP